MSLYMKSGKVVKNGQLQRCDLAVSKLNKIGKVNQNDASFVVSGCNADCRRFMG